ncbi:MAG: hypothetical protein AAFX08_03935 [Pseudomonadota bacterium]
MSTHRWPTQTYEIASPLPPAVVANALAPHFTDEKPRIRPRSDRPFFGVVGEAGFEIKTVVGAREASRAVGDIRPDGQGGSVISVVQRPRPPVYGAAVTGPLISFGVAAFTVWTLSPDTVVRVLGIILPAALSLMVPARIIRVMFLPEVALTRHVLGMAVAEKVRS